MSTAVLEKTGVPAKAAKSKKPKSKRLKAPVAKPPMTQMNVRIDTETKKQGDRALERIGLSPSEAVRALWEFVVRHANEPEVLRQLIAKLEDQEEDNLSTEEDPVRKGWEIMDEAYRTLGITPKPLPEDDDERLAYYEELREEAYWERLKERGLL